MRIDLFLKKTGLVKRRTVAQNLIKSGLIKVNGNPTKPGKEIHIGDTICIRDECFSVLSIPHGNVKKEERKNYVEKIDDSNHPG